jgi:hypothetical protein
MKEIRRGWGIGNLIEDRSYDEAMEKAKLDMSQMSQTMNVKAREGEQGGDGDDGRDVLVAKRQSNRCEPHS